MAKTAIEWTDYTWNPIRARITNPIVDPWNRYPKPTPIGWHCEHVSEGCRNCYAEVMNRRLGTGLNFKPGHRLKSEPDIEILLDEKMLLAPLRWKKPRRIFVCSMTDIGASFVTDGMLDRIFAVMAYSPQHTFMVLTKRSERLRAYIDNAFDRVVLEMMFLRELYKLPTVKETRGKHGLPFVQPQDGSDWWPLRNVWLGTSCEDQPAANERIPHLLATPAAIRFLSCEPLLGSIDLTSLCTGWHFVDCLRGVKYHDAPEDVLAATEECPKIDWVIVGGESGPNPRPMHPDWARSLRDQCARAEVPFFHKQNGEWVSVSEVGGPGPIYKFADGASVRRVGKKRAGRLLDGVEHNGMPGQ